MFLLDTNVLSEIRRKSPPAISWLARHAEASIFLSVMTVGEIARGIALLAIREPDRAIMLRNWLDSLRRIYAGQILPVDEHVMLEWGRISAKRPRGDIDAVIAATASVHRLTLVTRNVRDFSDLDIPIIDPWAG